LNKPKPLPKKKTTEKVVETLNPNAAMKSLSLQDTKQQQVEEEDDDQDIEMNAQATAFSKLRGFEDSYKYLERYPEVINEKNSDAILGQAFTAQLKGEAAYAKNCVIQSLMLQYCGQLGKDGVKVFFSR
jgi:cell division cycle protein 37